MATIHANQKDFLVQDATARSEMADVISETTLAGLAGPVAPECTPTAYTCRREAEHNARRRLFVARVARRLAELPHLPRCEGCAWVVA